MTSIVPLNIVDRVRRLDASRRFLALAGLAVAAVLVWVLANWAMKPTMIPLFPDQRLSLAEAGSITEQLDAQGIPYTIEGTEVRVPATQVQRARMNFAREDLGIGSCGSPTAFAFGSSAVEQQMSRLQSIRSQLECTIRQMNGIEKAAVALTLREQTAFRRMGLPAKASVTVWPSAGRRLTPDVVSGITYLVSSAVEGLESTQVAVVDGVTGRPLTVPNDEGSSVAKSSRELEVRREVERHLKAKAEEMLVTVLPPAEFEVQISAELDWTTIQRTSEQFDPEGQAIMREEASEVPPGAAGPGSPAYTSEQRESRYSRTVENLTNSPGSIERLSVAVFVNERAAVFGGDVSSPPNPALLTQQIARIEEIVRSAVGYDAQRGDQVVVRASPFWAVGDTTFVAAPQGSAAPNPIGILDLLLRPIVGLAGIIAVLIVAMKVLKPLTTGFSRRGALAQGVPSGALDSGMYPLDEVVGSPKLDASARLKDLVSRETSGNPETTARVVRAWLSEQAS
jgi:flagellar M-ring protein FliF